MLLIFLHTIETDEERIVLADFYNEHKGRCLRVALAITRDHTLAEDAVQDAFIKMMKHKEKYFSDSGKRTASQIVIMVKSAAIDLLRRENRLDHDMLDDLEPIIPNQEPDVLRIVAGKESVERLQYHVSQLDETSQSLFEMKYILQQSDGEIAEMLGLKKNTVAVRLHRLTKNLYEIMRREGYIDG